MNSAENDPDTAEKLFAVEKSDGCLFLGHLMLETALKAHYVHIRALEEQGIQLQKAVLFGSHALGQANEWSDIDIALVSEAFAGDRFVDRRKIRMQILQSIGGRTHLRQPDRQRRPVSFSAGIL